MGNDAFVHISKKSYSKKMIEKLLRMMDYKKYGEIFYCGNDEEYKYYSGIKVWQCDENENEIVYRVRTQAFSSGYDIQKQNETIRCLKKYCMGHFESDVGKNRYFEIVRLVKGAESGCYFAIQNLDNSFSLLCHSLSKYPEDQEGERGMLELSGIPTPSIFNANVYLAYLCSLIEEYFRSTYISLLKYSEKKEKILNMKFSPYDMVDISERRKSVEEVYSRTLSFQNIGKVTSNFKALNSKLDISKPLKEPYHKRKESLYDQINKIFERRHNIIHRMEIDTSYSAKELEKDIKDVKVALKRVYSYICNQYNWKAEEIII